MLLCYNEAIPSPPSFSQLRQNILRFLLYWPISFLRSLDVSLLIKRPTLWNDTGFYRRNSCHQAITGSSTRQRRKRNNSSYCCSECKSEIYRFCFSVPPCLVISQSWSKATSQTCFLFWIMTGWLWAALRDIATLRNHTLLISQQVIKCILLRNIYTLLVCFRSFHTSEKE